jgi:hypothetical protein
MARWKAIRLAAVVFVLLFVFAAGIVAANMPEVLKVKTPYERTRGEVTFTHQKHIDDYKIGCGECHHDAKGQPLTQLKAGDPVQNCVDCHSKPGEIKGKEARELSPQQKRAYHANAVHDNCIDCHRQYNKDKQNKPAPQTCKACHGGADQ